MRKERLFTFGTRNTNLAPPVAPSPTLPLALLPSTPLFIALRFLQFANHPFSSPPMSLVPSLGVIAFLVESVHTD